MATQRPSQVYAHVASGVFPLYHKVNRLSFFGHAARAGLLLFLCIPV